MEKNQTCPKCGKPKRPAWKYNPDIYCFGEDESLCLKQQIANLSSQLAEAVKTQENPLKVKDFRKWSDGTIKK